MLADSRPTFAKLAQEPFLVTMRHLVRQETPPNPDQSALLEALHFSDKNKALLAMFSLFKCYRSTEITIQPILTEAQIVAVTELLVVCLSMTSDYDQICQTGIQWVL
jgi:hypothetical protein